MAEYEPEEDTMYRIGQAHIPGYTGYMPGKKEQVGLGFAEASRGILAELADTDELHPQIPLVGPRPESVRNDNTALASAHPNGSSGRMPLASLQIHHHPPHLTSLSSHLPSGLHSKH